MRKKKAQVHIGTSGWSYSHWKENFYPKEIKPANWLEYYSHAFSTVEINNTFYRMPKKSTVEKWHEDVPDAFIFSIKISRYISHRKKLHDCKESLDFFYQRIKPMGSKTGPILIQLPPSFKANQERLIDFIGYLNTDYKHTFEFRHPSWFTEDIYELLNKNKIALCITDLNKKLSPEEITSDFTYIRLHGPKKAYQGSYGKANLRNWKKKIDRWLASSISVFCYFDNDEKGFAIEDAKVLQSYYS